jgi:hypothetical protein
VAVIKLPGSETKVKKADTAMSSGKEQRQGAAARSRVMDIVGVPSDESSGTVKTGPGARTGADVRGGRGGTA